MYVKWAENNLQVKFLYFKWSPVDIMNLAK